MKLSISQYGKNRRTSKKLKSFIKRKQLSFAAQRTPLALNSGKHLEKAEFIFFY